MSTALAAVDSTTSEGEFLRHEDSFQTAPLWSAFWDSAGAGFAVKEGWLHAADGGRAETASHVLTRQRFRNLVMQWLMVRKADAGDERAQVLVAVPEDLAGGIAEDRRLDLPTSAFQVGRTYRMRLVVVDGQATVYRAAKGSRAEEVLARRRIEGGGRLGFRHEARYAFAYDNVCITSFSGAAAPAVEDFAAVVAPGGAVRLSWHRNEELAGIFRQAIYRATDAAMTDRVEIGTTAGEGFDDLPAPGRDQVFYQVVTRNLAGADDRATLVQRVSLGLTAAPGPVPDIIVCPRRSGGVAVRFAAIRGEPVDAYRILHRADAAAADAGRVVRRLPAGEPRFLVALPGEPATGSYAVVAEDAQGRCGPARWLVPAEPPPLTVAGSALVELLGPTDPGAWTPPAIPPVEPGRPPLTGHPRLQFTAAQIARARQRIASQAWARDCLADVLRRAEREREQDRRDPAGRRNTVYQRALAYALTGDATWAAEVRERLIYWADRYRSLPLQHDEAAIAGYQLYENGNLNENGAQAYDLIHETLSEADRAHIENDLLRPLTENQMRDCRGTGNVFHTAFNFQCLRISAVGHAGFCLGEQRYIDWALRARHGLLHQIGGQLNDDGLWWEKSISYHVTTAMRPLYELAEVAYNHNLDVWRTPVPDTSLENHEDVRYPLDGDSGPKTLRYGFDGLTRILFPDRTAPTFGDSCSNPWWGGGAAWPAYRSYRDPALAWLNARVANGAHRLLWEPDEAPAGATGWRIGSGRFAGNGVAERGSTLFPSSGLAMLRQDEADSQAPVLAFTYGPFGGGHNHPDRLAFLLYSAGGHPLFHTATYPDPEYGAYRWHSISYNTVTVDETSHSLRDGAERPNTGQLDFFHGGEAMQAVGARVACAYPDVELRRALLMGPGCLVDILICRSANPHQYDYALHFDGEWPADSFAPAAAGTMLGRGNGYQQVELAGTIAGDGLDRAWEFPSRAKGGGNHQLRHQLLPEPGTALLACRAAGEERNQPLRAMLVARRQARSTVFISVFSLPGREPPCERATTTLLTDAGVEGVRVGLQLERGPLRDTVIYHERADSSRVGEARLTGRAAWFSARGGRLERAEAVAATAAAYDDRSASFAEPRSGRVLATP